MSNNPLFIKSIKPLQTHNHAGSNVTYEMKRTDIEANFNVNQMVSVKKVLTRTCI